MGNKEKRHHEEFVHLFMGLQRTKDGEKSRCIRHIIRDEKLDLEIFKSKLKIMGGIWRIHKTVNARDCVKAFKWLQKKFIDLPECAMAVDTWWRTALLQKECIYGKKKFLFDVDTKDKVYVCEARALISAQQIHIDSFVETPNGYHFVTNPFDTREVCKLPYVSLQRDGYVFVEKIDTNN